MKIIAHRGLWSHRSEGNTMASFEAAFKKGYGIETDVRDYNGELIVSHNVAKEKTFLFEDVLKLYKDLNCTSLIAINIKADGIQKMLGDLLNKYAISNYFVFDMSIPEQVVYHKMDFKVATRMSEYERGPVLSRKSVAIWMDEWEESWINANEINKFREAGKLVSIISPEIHGRDNAQLWQELTQFKEDDRVILCTDIPLEAEAYFYES